MTTHIGKIGRLPKAIRDTLGGWIEDGKPGKDIVQELNALPGVQELCQSAFGGRPISEQNLSDWKQRGHQEWLRREERRRVMEALLEQADELAEATDGADIPDRFAVVLAAEMTRLAMTLLENETDPEQRWERLCQIRRELSALRRDDQRAERVAIRREQWDRELEREAEAEVKQAEQRRKQGLMEALLLPQGEDGRMSELLHRIEYDLPLGDLLKPKSPGKAGRGDAAARGAGGEEDDFRARGVRGGRATREAEGGLSEVGLETNTNEPGRETGVPGNPA